MVYTLPVSRFQTYQRCPQADYFRYERHMSNPIGHRAAGLGRGPPSDPCDSLP